MKIKLKIESKAEVLVRNKGTEERLMKIRPKTETKAEILDVTSKIGKLS